MDKQQVDQRNMDFVSGALQQMAPKNARFGVALVITQQNEILILNDTSLTDKDIHTLLVEAARAIENKNKDGRIILLN